MKIKDVNLIDSITGTEKVPVSAGTDAPATVSLDQIKDFIKETPDWRSSEGESGYINGRTHYTYRGASETPIVEVDVPKYSDVGSIIELIKTDYSYDPISFEVAIGGTSCFVDGKEYNELSGSEIEVTWDFFEQSSYTHRLSYNNMGTLSVDLTAYYEYDSGEECYNYYIKLELVSNSGYEGSVPELRLHDVVTRYKTLDDKYLPNTFIKKTAQTLTNAEKTQVKSNLGIPDIDPVVWKYICNPYIIYEGKLELSLNPEALRVAKEKKAYACVKVIYLEKTYEIVDIEKRNFSQFSDSENCWLIRVYTGSDELNIEAALVTDTEGDNKWELNEDI